MVWRSGLFFRNDLILRSLRLPLQEIHGGMAFALYKGEQCLMALLRQPQNLREEQL